MVSQPAAIVGTSQLGGPGSGDSADRSAPATDGKRGERGSPENFRGLFAGKPLDRGRFEILQTELLIRFLFSVD
jgi:hypothetical protein